MSENSTEVDRIAQEKKTKRNHGVTSGNGRPKPNIIKIKVLSGEERQRYLVSAIQQSGDNIKSTIQEQLRKDGDDIFYGFINSTGGAKQSLKFNARWNLDQDGGGLLGTIKGLARDTSSTLTRVSDAMGDILNDLTGVSSTSTGSSSLKRFQGTDIESFTLDVGWYLPEQLQLCKKSLKTLNRMVYPLQLGSADAKIALETLLSGDDIGNAFIDLDNAIPRSPADQENEGATPTNQSNSPEQGNDQGSIRDLLRTGGGAAISAITAINKLFGRNMTFDPLPVRVWVGHYMDIEPLIITGMDIQFSKETFRREKSNGKTSDLPIFCTVSINFSYWLNPAPKMEFLSLIEQEMFGQHFEPESELDAIEIVKKKAASKQFAATESILNRGRNNNNG